MKITNLAIIFIIIILPFVIMTNIQSESMKQSAYNKLQIDSIIDTAVEDAVAVMVERANNNEIIINKDLGIQTFYNTVFLNFGAINDTTMQKRLMGYVPAIIVVDYDGCYVFAQDKYLVEGYKVKPEWYPKVPFVYTDSDYIYMFTLDDYLTVYDMSNGQFNEGFREVLLEEIDSNIISDEEAFDEVRRRTIIDTIEQEMLNSINNHNDIAYQYGINYGFSLPVIEQEDWYRTIDDISMIVFFQGVPIGLTGEYYNSFAIGGAMVVKGADYYIQEDVNSGVLYYHRESCSLLSDDSWVEGSREDCAMEGAFPCEGCRP